jgi:hypothetical protein
MGLVVWRAMVEVDGVGAVASDGGGGWGWCCGE